MRSKAQRRKDSAAVAQRFPKGSTKGDTLGYTIPLGNSLRKPDNLSFGSQGKGYAVKRFGVK